MTDALGALREGLERRQTVAAARALLELMQDTAHVMSKVCTCLQSSACSCSLCAQQSIRHQQLWKEQVRPLQISKSSQYPKIG